MARPIKPGDFVYLRLECARTHRRDRVMSFAFCKTILNRQAGFSYIGILMLMLIASISMAGVGMVWHIQIQRSKEQQLLFAGTAIRKAISGYYNATPGGGGEYPTTLESLLLDERQTYIKRHLRRLYNDPMGKNRAWALIMQNNRIIGVQSQSLLKPIKTDGFPLIYESFRGAKTYQDWKFVYVPGME